MARRGRKRKTGKREPNGRLQRERGIDQNEVAAQLPHRTAAVCWLNLHRAIPADKRHDPKAEHRLGRYNLAGFISDVQYDAGQMFLRDVLECRRTLSTRKEVKESIAGFAQPAAPTPKEIDDKEAIRIMADYMDAYNSIAMNLGSIVGRQAQLAIKQVVIFDLEIAPYECPYLSLGLTNLVGHYKNNY